MVLPIEAEISERARVLSVVSARPVAGVSAAEIRQRAQGEFLRYLVRELQPMLRDSMGSHQIFVASDGSGVVSLKSDGTFVHVGGAGQEDVLDPLEVLRTESSLRTILDRIEAELLAVADPRATTAADIVRLAHHSLGVAGTP